MPRTLLYDAVALCEKGHLSPWSRSSCATDTLRSLIYCVLSGWATLLALRSEIVRASWSLRSSPIFFLSIAVSHRNDIYVVSTAIMCFLDFEIVALSYRSRKPFFFWFIISSISENASMLLCILKIYRGTDCSHWCGVKSHLCGYLLLAVECRTHDRDALQEVIVVTKPYGIRSWCT